jgi:hypothetical protein
MNKIHHPTNKLERIKILEKKKKKQRDAERSGDVHGRVLREHIRARETSDDASRARSKLQETEDELRKHGSSAL